MCIKCYFILTFKSICRFKLYWCRLDFDYKKFRLTQKEFIYYFERLTVRGLCLAMLLEMIPQLSRDFKLVPLVRPSELNNEAQEEAARKHSQHLTMFSEYVSNILTKKVDELPEGTEVIQRPGNQDIPNYSISRDRSVLNNYRSGNTSEVNLPRSDVNDAIALSRQPKKRLLAIVDEEGINLKKLKRQPITRIDFAKIIIANRRKNKK